MKIQRKCGIMELGNLEALNEEPGVSLRTSDGDEIVLGLSKEEARALGKAGLLFCNLVMTLTLEDDGTTP